MTTPPEQPREEDRLAPPGRKVRALMASHLRDKHQIEPFRLNVHVHLGGPRLATEHLTWLPAKASFLCDFCPGQIIWSGEVTEEMIDFALLFDPALQPHLAGLRTQADRREMARSHLTGDLNRERLRQLRGADARRRAAHGSRPNVDARKGPVQAWLLAQVRERGVFERALDEAERLQREERDTWFELCDQLKARETLRDWWQDIDPRERQAAFQAGRAAQQAKKSTR